MQIQQLLDPIFSRLKRANWVEITEEDRDKICELLNKADTLVMRSIAVKLRGSRTVILVIGDDE